MDHSEIAQPMKQKHFGGWGSEAGLADGGHRLFFRGIAVISPFKMLQNEPFQERIGIKLNSALT